MGPGRYSELARALAAQHEGRRGLLVRTRQQTLNEMVLEPITGLDGHRYVADAALASPSEVPAKAMALEMAAVRLYEESADVARSLLTEAARTFRKLADEALIEVHGRRIVILDSDRLADLAETCKE